MPGTIHVSVLEFMAFQSSSPVRQMSIKISLGKKEHQTWDKGDFSFPLTTLRENLIVTLQDAQGKEISHTVVETRLVIEKGTWDDIFPFEGGGHVHMKLQFVLSEEERHRIRIMRESALRKKHSELLNKEGTHSVHNQTNPNDTDRLEDPSSAFSSSAKFDVDQQKGSTSTPIRNIHSEEASGFGSSGSVIAAKNQAPAKLKVYEANDTQKQSTTEKTPSKIRNMISAFENSLNQDMKSNVRPTSVISQSSKSIRREDQTGGIRALAGSTSSLEAGRLKKLRAGHIQNEGTTVDLKGKVEAMYKVDIQEVKTSSEKLARTSIGERASVSGRMLIEKGTQVLSNLFAGRRNSGGNSLKIEQNKGKEIQPKGSQDAKIQANLGDEPHSSEGYGAWIFPDGGKRMCITTGGKQIMDLMGSFHAESKSQQGKMNYPIVENEIEEKEGDKTSPSKKHTESVTEGSTDAETSRGSVGQVMRVVIMVGFATLVFFTRQRKPGTHV
ncbi:uncharacterized protein LOC110610757 isoform X3 [Manihot esculenta]|uniref:uncharacterized protein LOC110610757 isoform X3 n=1 Tax=Manihot esculenta TaxID=3983 RepID=UPI001CC6C930|nr:uncharacterized protein LOC110610757 isoform X3 [Manihot esculenta]